MANHPLRGSSVVCRAPFLSVILVIGTAGCGLFQTKHDQAPAASAVPAAPEYDVTVAGERLKQVPIGTQPDGTFLSVAAAAHGTMLVAWDLDAGRPRAIVTSTYHNSDLDLASQRVVDCLDGSRTVVWDARSGKEVWVAKTSGSESWHMSCCFSPGALEVYREGDAWDGNSHKTIVGVFDGATGRRIRTQDWMPSAFFPDGKTALVAAGKVLKRVELPDGKVVAEIDPFMPAREVRISPDGSRVLVQTAEDIRIFDAESGREVSRIQDRTVWAFWTPDGQVMTDGPYLNSGLSWNRYDSDTGRARGNIKGGRAECTSMGFSPDGRYLILNQFEGLLFVNLESNRTVATAMVFEDGMWAIATPQGYYAASDRGFDHLQVRQGLTGQFKPMYAMRQQLERPDVVAAALHTGDAEAAAAGAAKDHGGSARPQ